MLQRISRRLTLLVFLLMFAVPAIHAQTGTDPEPPPSGTSLILVVISALQII